MESFSKNRKRLAQLVCVFLVSSLLVGAFGTVLTGTEDSDAYDYETGYLYYHSFGGSTTKSSHGKIEGGANPIMAVSALGYIVIADSADTATIKSPYISTTASLRAVPDEGYKFDSWGVANPNTNTWYKIKPLIPGGYDGYFNVNKVPVVDAYFTPETYAVTFYNYGHDFVVINEKFDSKYRLPDTPHKVGYTFKGWNTATDGTGTWITDSSVVKIASNHRLFAIWGADSYGVTLDKNGGTASGSATATFDSGTLTNVIDATNTDPDKKLAGYYTATDGGSRVITSDGKLEPNVLGYTNHYGNWERYMTPTTLYAHWVDAAKVIIPSASVYTYDGTAKTCVATSDKYTITGDNTATDAGEYSVTLALKNPTTDSWDDGTTTNKTINWSIFPKDVTITGITVEDKTYDGTAVVTITGTPALSWMHAGDDVAITDGGAEFSGEDAGDYVPVIFHYSLSGGKANNYHIIQPTAYATIFVKDVTITGITANDKVYDGDAVAALDFSKVVIDGKIDGDVLSVSASGTFSDMNAGTDKVVNIVDYVLGGADGENYDVSVLSQVATTASIAKKSVTVSGITAYNKTYDGNTDAKLNYDGVVIDGKVVGDLLGVTAKGTFDSADVGKGKTVTISELTLVGYSASNYVLAETGQQTTTTADIVVGSAGSDDNHSLAAIFICVVLVVLFMIFATKTE